RQDAIRSEGTQVALSCWGSKEMEQLVGRSGRVARPRGVARGSGVQLLQQAGQGGVDGARGLGGPVRGRSAAQLGVGRQLFHEGLALRTTRQMLTEVVFLLGGRRAATQGLRPFRGCWGVHRLSPSHYTVAKEVMAPFGRRSFHVLSP